MLNRGKVTKIYCIADDFRKEFAQEFKKLQIMTVIIRLYGTQVIKLSKRANPAMQQPQVTSFLYFSFSF